MARDLTTSPLDRQNILNNPYALAEIEKAANIKGIPFEGTHVVLKEQVAAFFDVTVRTVENYLQQHADELANNGYEVLKGKRLISLKESLSTMDVPEIDFGNIRRTPQLGAFNFKAFLNLAMLMAESERARLLRMAILDIVLDTVAKRTGGGTKYINQRDEEFLQAAFSGESYRRQFTDALRDYVDMGNFKYPLFTDKIYESIFAEKTKEYKKVLNLTKADRTRDTFYSEVINLIAAFEYGFAESLRTRSNELGRKLTALEVDELFRAFEIQPLWKPLRDNAREKMASRDLVFRDALHKRLEEYIIPVQREEFERFLGEKSKELQERLEDAKDVLKRLRDR